MWGCRREDRTWTSRRKLSASSGLEMRTIFTASCPPRQVPMYVVPNVPSPNFSPISICTSTLVSSIHTVAGTAEAAFHPTAQSCLVHPFTSSRCPAETCFPAICDCHGNADALLAWGAVGSRTSLNRGAIRQIQKDRKICHPQMHQASHTIHATRIEELKSLAPPPPPPPLILPGCQKCSTLETDRQNLGWSDCSDMHQGDLEAVRTVPRAVQLCLMKLSGTVACQGPQR